MICRVALLVAVAAAAPCNFRLDFDGVRHEAVFDDGADDDELASIVRNVLDRVVDHYDEGALLKFYGSVAADCDGASAPFKDCFTNKLRKAFAARRATCLSIGGEEPACAGTVHLGNAAPKRCKVLVTGTGRAATTFLMRIFALLGLDTGFDAGEAAGESFERPFRSAARILKSMWFIIRKDLRVGAQEHLTWPYLASTLSFVIVPLRDLGAVSKSRAVRGAAGGGLYTKFYAAYFPASYGDEAADVARERQEKIDADDMVHLHTYLLDYEIPHVYLSFDRLTIDEGYAYRALAPLLRGYDVSRADFRRAYDAAAALYRGDDAIVEVT